MQGKRLVSKRKEGWGCSVVVEHLSRTCKAPASISSHLWMVTSADVYTNSNRMAEQKKKNLPPLYTPVSEKHRPLAVFSSLCSPGGDSIYKVKSGGDTMVIPLCLWQYFQSTSQHGRLLKGRSAENNYSFKKKDRVVQMKGTDTNIYMHTHTIGKMVM